MALTPQQELDKLFAIKDPTDVAFEAVMTLIRDGQLNINAMGVRGMTVLIKAVMCSADLVNRVKECIALGADLRAAYVPSASDLPLAASPSNLPQTALPIAAAYGNLECLKQLLPKDFNFERAQYRFAIKFANLNKHYACLHTLVVHSAFLAMGGAENKLLQALHDGGVAGLTTLLSSSTDITLETIQEALSKLNDVKVDNDWYSGRHVNDIDITAILKPIQKYRAEHYPVLQNNRRGTPGFFACFSCISRPVVIEEDAVAVAISHSLPTP